MSVNQKDYEYVSADNLDELTVKVNKKLENGWIALGGPICKNLHIGQGSLHQAIVKQDSDNEKIYREKTIIKSPKRQSGVKEDEDNVWKPTWEGGEEELV